MFQIDIILFISGKSQTRKATPSADSSVSKRNVLFPYDLYYPTGVTSILVSTLAIRLNFCWRNKTATEHLF